MTAPFPKTPGFSGPNRPFRAECDIFDLEIEGEIPRQLNGSWYRVGADPQYPPHLGNDIFINGDGIISMFRFENGHIDFRMRYVRTERWTAERAARRSLFGAKRPACFSYHVLNAHTEGSRVTVDLCVAARNPFPFFPDVSGAPYDPEQGKSRLTRWVFDLARPSDTFEERRLYDLGTEMPRIDDRYAMTKNRFGYLGMMDPRVPVNELAGPAGAAFNHLACLDLEAGTAAVCHVGDASSVQEPQFIAHGSKGSGTYVGVSSDARNLTDPDLCYRGAQLSDSEWGD
jgi:carotenoid cleavage dioxygenase-like enzyme